MIELPIYKASAYSASDIVSGTIGLTDAQGKELAELQAKDKRTEKQAERLVELLDKQAKKELPSGLKTHCEKWLKQKLYARKKEFSSKFTERGIFSEAEALEFVSSELGILLTKNDEYFENDFFKGIPDVLPPTNYGIDLKCPWDCFTFPLFDKSIPDPSHFWQGQTYLDLFPEKEFWRFSYVLIDTPMHIIKGEANSWCRKNGEELTPEIMEQFVERFTYDGIDNRLRYRSFDVYRDEEAIKLLRSRVLVCREYIEQLVDEMYLSNNSQFVTN